MRNVNMLVWLHRRVPSYLSFHNSYFSVLFGCYIIFHVKNISLSIVKNDDALNVSHCPFSKKYDCFTWKIILFQAHEDGKESKPPPPLPRAPVRPPALLNNGGGKAGSMTSGPPPIPNKPVLSVSSGGGLGMTRSPSPDELPPPPPPPSEDVEVLTNDDPLPPPPTVTEVDVLFGSRTRSVSGL